MLNNYQFIQSQQELDSLTRRDVSVIGFDTEFTRRNTYHAIPELLQIAIGDEVYLLDLKARLDLSQLAQWFRSREITRVGHGIDQDLQVLDYIFKIDIGPIEDIQLARCFVGAETEEGYSSIVQELLGIELSKSEQVSDWAQRPFTDSQLNYAANDVRFLLSIWEILSEELLSRNKVIWYEEERDRRQCPTEGDPFGIVASGSRIRRLTLAGFDFVINVEKMRESHGKSRNLPKNWILSSEKVYKIAALKRCQPKHLKGILTPKELSRFGARLSQMHFQSVKRTRNAKKPSLSKLWDYSVSLCRSFESIASVNQIPRTLLASNKELVFALQYCIETGELPDWLGKWRVNLIGDQVMSAAVRWNSESNRKHTRKSGSQKQHG